MAIYHGAGTSSGSILDFHLRAVASEESNERGKHASGVRVIRLSSVNTYESLDKTSEGNSAKSAVEKRRKIIHQHRYQVRNHMECMLPRTLSFVSIRKLNPGHPQLQGCGSGWGCGCDYGLPGPWVLHSCPCQTEVGERKHSQRGGSVQGAWLR